MFIYLPWCYSVHLCLIVQEGHAAFPIYLYLGHILYAIPPLKRVQIQEGSL